MKVGKTKVMNIELKEGQLLSLKSSLLKNTRNPGSCGRLPNDPP